MSRVTKRYSKKHYRLHKKEYRERNERRKELRKKWLLELKSFLCCSVCSENHPACLHFHHKDPSTKSASVSRMVNDGQTEKAILNEIQKCVVLCANCHAKLHAQ